MPTADELPPHGSEVSVPRTVTTTELFAGSSELVIVHGDAQYRLRITRQDKLILTK